MYTERCIIVAGNFNYPTACVYSIIIEIFLFTKLFHNGFFHIDTADINEIN